MLKKPGRFRLFTVPQDEQDPDKIAKKDDIDACFEKIEAELTVAFAQTTATAKPAEKTTTMKRSEQIMLFDICNMEIREKIKHLDIEKLSKEPAYGILGIIMNGMLMVPREKRVPLIPSSFLYRIRQEGLIRDLLSVRSFYSENRTELYIVCDIILHRIDVMHMLTGVFMFRHTLSGDTLEEKDNDDEDEKTIVRKQTISLKLLRQSCILFNFFFDVVTHLASDPLPTLPY